MLNAYFYLKEAGHLVVVC